MKCQSSGPKNARIMIIGEAPGEREENEGIPFVGASGWELTKMLQEAGITRTSCLLTNVCRYRPPSNDITKWILKTKTSKDESFVKFEGKPVHPFVVEGVEELHAEIAECRPSMIIALGNTPLWALTGKEGVTKWRGSCLWYEKDGLRIKVIPTYHPAGVLRNWKWRSTCIHDLKKAAREAQRPDAYDVPEYNFTIRPTFEQAYARLAWLLQKVEKEPLRLAVDIETRAGHTACIGLAWSATDAICIPLMEKTKPTGYWTLEEELTLSFMLYQLLTHPNAYCIGQNFSYDTQYFNRHHCFTPRLGYDTMIAQHTLFSSLPKGLDFLSSMYCRYHVYWKDEGKDWKDPQNEDEYWAYNCKDCVTTFEVADVLEGIVEKMHLEGPAAFQQEMFWPVVQTMERGVRVDLDRRASLRADLVSEMDEIQKWLDYVLGYELNMRSPAQVADLFYKQLGQRPVMNRKTGSTTTDDEALQKVAQREPLLRPLVDAILNYRSKGVLLSTFIDCRLDLDERFRCSYNIAGNPEGRSAPSTYRLSSSENAFGSGGNLQNIPPFCKPLFIPDEDKEIFDMDLSSADLRIVVWEADEREMKSLLSAGLNPYVEIAKEYYHDPSITKEHPRYRIFKSFAHGTHYLGTPEGMAGKLGMSIPDVERLQKWYFNRFPRIRQWQQNFVAKVYSRHMVENIFGYRYYIFDRIEGHTINQAIAWLPQSTIAILINKIWMNIYRQHPEIEILLQTHDSLTGQYPASRREECLSLIESASQIVLPYSEPLIIPTGVKTSLKSWGDCH